MRARWLVLAAVLSIPLAYVAYPYVTLYRLGVAIRGGDEATLQSLVDWPAVREGIKEDVCDLAAEDPAPQTANGLLPFGASFMRGIASTAIDQAVTARALLAAATTVSDDKPPKRGADVRVNWAFFDSPSTFMVSLVALGQTEPVKLEMDLRHGVWRVRRVWLPSDLLAPGGSRT